MDNIFIRKVDELGRTVIPKELREHFDIKSGDAFIMKITSEGILLIPKKTSIDDK